jgi:hypothetical protein
LFTLSWNVIRVACAEELSKMKTQLSELKEDVEIERKRTADLDNSLHHKTLQVSLVFRLYRTAYLYLLSICSRLRLTLFVVELKTD